MLAEADTRMAHDAGTPFDAVDEVADEFGGAPDAIDRELQAERAGRV
jgi:hypothetical protein